MLAREGGEITTIFIEIISEIFLVRTVLGRQRGAETPPLRVMNTACLDSQPCKEGVSGLRKSTARNAALSKGRPLNRQANWLDHVEIRRRLLTTQPGRSRSVPKTRTRGSVMGSALGEERSTCLPRFKEHQCKP